MLLEDYMNGRLELTLPELPAVPALPSLPSLDELDQLIQVPFDLIQLLPLAYPVRLAAGGPTSHSAGLGADSGHGAGRAAGAGAASPPACRVISKAAFCLTAAYSSSFSC